MRLLYDAALPQSLAHEAPADVELRRWAGDAVPDAEVVSAAAGQGCRGVILLGRDSLASSDLRAAAREFGVALIATSTSDPIQAKRCLIKNLRALRLSLADHDSILVLAAEVRPTPTGRA